MTTPGEIPADWTADTVFQRFESRTNLERTQPQLRLYRLDRMVALLRRLGSPETALPTIHVAGSKGKGSTCAYITSLLAAAGHTVGLYTSPHVRGYRERFAVIPPGYAVGEPVGADAPAAAQEITEGGTVYERTLAREGYALWQVVEAMVAEGTPEDELPTTFELLTALAFRFFPAVGCDHVVLETGLGGRLDATNVCRPDVSVLTRIELEHTEYLGDTIAKIAAEKAGIIKPDTPVVCARQRPEALSVFTETARQRGAPLTMVDISAGADGPDGDAGGDESDGTDRQRDPDAIALPAAHAERLGVPEIRPAMVGAVQRENICQALTVYRLLTDAGRAADASPERIIRALERCRLPGRGELIGDLFLDGAHTPESVTAVVHVYTRRYPAGTRVPVILGVVAGKDVEGIARALAPIAQQIIVSTPGRFKPGDPGNVADRIRAEHGAVELIPDSTAALARARELRGPRSEIPILVTGSFYMVAELRRLVSADR